MLCFVRPKKLMFPNIAYSVSQFDVCVAYWITLHRIISATVAAEYYTQNFSPEQRPTFGNSGTGSPDKQHGGQWWVWRSFDQHFTELWWQNHTGTKADCGIQQSMKGWRRCHLFCTHWIWENLWDHLCGRLLREENRWMTCLTTQYDTVWPTGQSGTSRDKELENGHHRECIIYWRWRFRMTRFVNVGVTLGPVSI